MEEEKQEILSIKEDKQEEIKEKTYLEELDERKKSLLEIEERLDKKKKELIKEAESIMNAGRGFAGRQQEKREETPKEYKERIMRGR